jgi:translation initiation factor eIF-2B subunit beta
VHGLRSEVIDGIEEIMDEISQVDDQIAGFAEVQIHPGNYILVYQPSPTIEKFLIRAAAKRDFTVLVVSSTPPKTADLPYASLRKKLSSAGVKTINILSGGLAAYMPQVSKVIIGASAVLSNGAILADGGAGLVARAAHDFSKPVVVLSGVYKLCPETISDFDEALELGDSSSHVSFTDGPLVEGVEVESVVAELIPPEHIDIYITNL